MNWQKFIEHVFKEEDRTFGMIHNPESQISVTFDAPISASGVYPDPEKPLMICINKHHRGRYVSLDMIIIDTDGNLTMQGDSDCPTFKVSNLLMTLILEGIKLASEEQKSVKQGDNMYLRWCAEMGGW